MYAGTFNIRTMCSYEYWYRINYFVTGIVFIMNTNTVFIVNTGTVVVLNTGTVFNVNTGTVFVVNTGTVVVLNTGTVFIGKVCIQIFNICKLIEFFFYLVFSGWWFRGTRTRREAPAAVGQEDHHLQEDLTVVGALVHHQEGLPEAPGLPVPQVRL